MSIFLNLASEFPFCWAVVLWNMEETSEELPNFSIGIDLLGPDTTSDKNKAEKDSQVARFADLSEDQQQQVLAERHSLGIHLWVHLALIFSISPVNFELFIHGYRLTGSNVLAQTKV